MHLMAKQRVPRHDIGALAGKGMIVPYSSVAGIIAYAYRMVEEASGDISGHP